MVSYSPIGPQRPLKITHEKDEVVSQTLLRLLSTQQIVLDR